LDFIAAGLFPLASEDPDEGMVSRWLRYATEMADPSIYPVGKEPDPDELKARKKIVQDAFDGITRARLAVYTVPSRYKLSDICEIFETLNTTGTKVSTVDLIHSWLYSETREMPHPMLLRDWISEMGELDGAVGWASREERPELFVQIVAGCYLASDNPPDPRQRGRRPGTIKSIKAGDLLVLPTEHWLAARERGHAIARFLRDFQALVGDGSAAFPFHYSPYPVTAGIYVGLRWKLEFEPRSDRAWGVPHLNALFRAFYWQNALSGRYDQGFLTKFGTDLEFMIRTLDARRRAESGQKWCRDAETVLLQHIGLPLPDLQALVEMLGDGKLGGARARALALPLRCRVKRDLLEPEIELGFPDGNTELHHFFPTKWCKDNNYGPLREYLEANTERSPVGAVCNLIPLSRTSNLEWSSSHPAAVIASHSIRFEARDEILKEAFIDEVSFGLLPNSESGVLEFWERRKALMAQDLLRRLSVPVVTE
jgi:hypothetical protein